MKTLIIYGIVAAVMIPSIYEIYNKLMNDGKSALVTDEEIITTKGKGDMTPEEIAQRAAEDEAERMAEFDRKMREKEEEMGIQDDE